MRFSVLAVLLLGLLACSASARRLKGVALTGDGVAAANALNQILDSADTEADMLNREFRQ